MFPYRYRQRICSLFMTVVLLATACTSTSPLAAVRPTGTTVVEAPTPPAVVPTQAPATPTATPSPPTPTATSQPTATPTPAATAPAVEATFSGQRALAHVQTLAGTIGSRPAGSKNVDAARDYIADQLGASGYQVARQPFTFAQMTDHGTELTVVQPATKTLDPEPFYNTATGDVTAEVVDVGLGRPQDFPPNTRGKIALIERGVMLFQDKVDNAAAAGASAVIMSNNQSGNFHGEVRNQQIPVVSISQEDGRVIHRSLAQGSVRLHLKVDVARVQQTAYNVVATKPGPTDRVVVIGAHYDSIEAGPGANDNASGTATVLELARATSGRSYPFAIRFVLFSAEELGLLGSHAYVQALSDAERKAIIAMINLDMEGVGDNLRIGGSDGLEQWTLDLARRAGIPAGRLDPSLRGASDHASFQAAGIPAVFLYRIDDPNYHTADDKPEFVKPENLTASGNLVLKLLDRLAAP